MLLPSGCLLLRLLEETNSAEAIRQEIKEKRRTYWRGAITGAASVMAVLLTIYSDNSMGLHSFHLRIRQNVNDFQ